MKTSFICGLSIIATYFSFGSYLGAFDGWGELYRTITRFYFAEASPLVPGFFALMAFASLSMNDDEWDRFWNKYRIYSLFAFFLSSTVYIRLSSQIAFEYVIVYLMVVSTCLYLVAGGLPQKHRKGEAKVKQSKTAKSQKQRKRVYNKRDGEWRLPSFDLLKSGGVAGSVTNAQSKQQSIENALMNLGIKLYADSIVTGAAFCRIIFSPAPGVRISTIAAAQKDIELAVGSKSVRVLAPIPGEKKIGVEIPVDRRGLVRIRSMIEHPEFMDSTFNLPLIIGQKIDNTPLVFALDKAPHVLVAGATGAGKSVWINSALISLLYRLSPVNLNLLLIDMKRVELKPYDGLPHLIHPVITDQSKAVAALSWLCEEMDRRYEALESVGARNITEFNAKGDETLAYIVCVIDELGDLMLTSKKQVEPLIVRLTQMSRAIGIHLILGTQRPDTSVITGIIKANVPTRISFAVASGVDSRVIIDRNGAESLTGQGDGLIISPSNIDVERFQGCFVDDTEIARVITDLSHKAQEDMVVTQDAVFPISNISQVSEMGGELDDHYDEALEIVRKTRKASTSYLQRMMSIGYPKAARIIEQMESRGVIGPANGSKPRQVYAD